MNSTVGISLEEAMKLLFSFDYNELPIDDVRRNFFHYMINMTESANLIMGTQGHSLRVIRSNIPKEEQYQFCRKWNRKSRRGKLPRILVRRANVDKPFCREKVVSTPNFYWYKAKRHANNVAKRMNRSNEAMYVSKYLQKWYLKMLESNPVYRYVRSAIAGWSPWQKSVADRL